MKPGPAISTRSADVREVGGRDDGFRDLARRALQRLRKTHGQVGLKIRALGAADHRIDVGVFRAEGFRDGGLQSTREHGSRVVTSGGHGELLAKVELATNGFDTANPSVPRPRSIRRRAPDLGPPQRRITTADN